MRCILKASAFICLLYVVLFAADYVPPDTIPPGGLTPDKVPMFVTFGFDDNPYGDGVQYFVDLLHDKKNPVGNGNPLTFDNAPCRISFYCTGRFAEVEESGADAKAAWKTAYEDGHEIANHSWSHEDTLQLNSNVDSWKFEMAKTNDSLSQWLGMPVNAIEGFRTPFLAYSVATFQALQAIGFRYDCSIEYNYGSNDGTGYLWPYMLDSGGIADTPGKEVEGSYPGIWELPVHTIITAPIGWSKTAGFDYNMWYQKMMSKAAFLSALKYNFDQRLKGNRAPFMFGTHTQYYSALNTEPIPNASMEEAREAMKEFIEYVLTKDEVRIVRMVDIVNWMENPVALGAVNISSELSCDSRVGMNFIIKNNSVQVTVEHAGQYTISVYTMAGKMVVEKNYMISAGSHSIAMNNPAISRGSYLVSFSGAGISGSTKLYMNGL